MITEVRPDEVPQQTTPRLVTSEHDEEDEYSHLNASFNFNDLSVYDNPEIRENSILDESMSTSILEEEPLTWHYFETGSKRGGRLLVSSDGYTYYVKKQFKNSVLWTCTCRSKKLPCYVSVTQVDNEYRYNKTARHIHPGDVNALTKVRVSNEVKKQASRHIFESASQIVNGVINENRRPHQPSLGNPDNFVRVANRFRVSKRPDEPKDINFEIDHNFLQTDGFLVADIKGNGYRHIIWATAEQLRILRSIRRWFMDGTFKVMNDPFRQGQLMSIHGFVCREGLVKQIPLAFVMMSRRRTDDYEVVLRKLKDVLVNPEVEGFVLDFEAAAWLAVRAVFPGITIKGCVFHYTQAVWRNVQSIGLQPMYQQRNSVHNYIRKLLALPFLPSVQIRGSFDELKARANTVKLQQLVDYMERQWMTNSVFDVPSWSVYRHDVRTNNDTEGWHHRLNMRAGGMGLPFYRLVPVLRNEANTAEEQAQLVRDGVTGRRIRKTYQKVQTAIRKLWDEYDANTICTSELLQRCARIYSPTVNVNEINL